MTVTLNRLNRPARRRRAILEHANPVLGSGQGKIGQASDHGDRDARARPGAQGGAGRGARGTKRPLAGKEIQMILFQVKTQESLVFSAFCASMRAEQAVWITAHITGRLPVSAVSNFQCTRY